MANSRYAAHQRASTSALVRMRVWSVCSQPVCARALRAKRTAEWKQQQEHLAPTLACSFSPVLLTDTCTHMPVPMHMHVGLRTYCIGPNPPPQSSSFLLLTPLLSCGSVAIDFPLACVRRVIERTLLHKRYAQPVAQY